MRAMPDPAPAEPADAPPEPAAAEPGPEAGAPLPGSLPCALCGDPISRDERPERFVNDKQVCARCEQQVLDELAAKTPVASTFPAAALGGLAGAVVGAIVWAAIAVATNFEVGYVAVLVGFLSGTCVKLAAGDKRGPVLQLLAAGIAVFGLAAAKFFTVSGYAVKTAGAQGLDLGYFDPRIFSLFVDVLPETLSPFDLLWIVLAVGAAYRIPALPRIRILRV